MVSISCCLLWPYWQSNLNLVEKNNDLIDKYFITTHPDALKYKNFKKNKLNFLPIPVDENIETLNIFKYKHRYKDLFKKCYSWSKFWGFKKKIK